MKNDNIIAYDRYNIISWQLTNYINTHENNIRIVSPITQHPIPSNFLEVDYLYIMHIHIKLIEKYNYLKNI